MIFRGIGEFADAILRHLDPAGGADLLADFRADFIEAGDWHRAIN
jgi:hypothetical protein